MKNKLLRVALSIAAIFTTSTAMADLAPWTGRQSVIQSANGPIGYNCEYNIYGKLVWVSTTGVCPSMFDVR